MAEPTKYNLAEAALPNGTIDFYTLLGADSMASEDELRGKIQAIYSESQANRDHRNLNKRREYQTLLELLPAARTALLEPPKRARYDEYLTSAKADRADVDFETFMNQLLGNDDDQMEEKTALLGTADRREPRVKVIKNPTDAGASKTTGRVPTSGPTAPTPNTSAGIVGGGVGFLVGALIGFLAFHHSIAIAIGAGLVLGIVGFFLMASKPSNKVGM